MALIFMFAAECGTSREDAAAVARHFAGLRWVLSDGLVSETPARAEDGWAVQNEDDGSWWACVAPSNLSRSGGGSEAEERQMDEVALHLYQRLRTAPPLYRFAAVGVETLHFNVVQNVLDMARVAHPLHGLVVRQDLWEQAGRPPAFESFSPGYYWQPYRRVR